LASQEKCGAVNFGTACAIPAIMATRNIENWKNAITILVTPLLHVPGLPVYAIIIACHSWYSCEIFNLQGLTLMLLYLLGFGMAILSACFEQNNERQDFLCGRNAQLQIAAF
jgi:Fe2+ transport system protein B